MLGSLTVPAAASAHAVLQGTSPQHGATLETQPRHPISGGLVFSIGAPGATASPTVDELIDTTDTGLAFLLAAPRCQRVSAEATQRPTLARVRGAAADRPLASPPYPLGVLLG